MIRIRQRRVAWIVLLGLFFTQLATAAYACPLLEAALGSPPPAAVPAPCDDMDVSADRTALCHEHCKVGLQLVDTQPADTAADGDVVVLFVATSFDDAMLSDAPVEPRLARSTAPPVFALSHRLRI